MATPYPITGASIAIAGADKLIGDRAYKSLFSDLGWSQADMRKVGAGEVLGGLLMVLKPTRRLGGAIVFAASTTMLLAEIKRGDPKLAAPRGAVLLAALGAVLLPG